MRTEVGEPVSEVPSAVLNRSEDLDHTIYFCKGLLVLTWWYFWADSRAVRALTRLELPVEQIALRILKLESQAAPNKRPLPPKLQIFTGKAAQNHRPRAVQEDVNM